MVEVNYMAVLVATVVAFGVGFTWYHPSVFGTMWMRLSGITPAMANEGKQNMMQSMVLGFVATLVSAYVLAHFVAVWDAVDFMGALQLGFWVWLGFQMPMVLGSVLWDRKPWALFALNGAYWLVSTVVMAVVLVFMA